MYTDGLLTLHYGKHPATLAAEVGAWYTGDRHVDVTLACDDGSVVKAHRVVLAAASPLLASLLRNPALDHVVHLSGVRKTQLTHLLEFLYNGEALIPVRIFFFFPNHNNFPSFLLLDDRWKNCCFVIRSRRNSRRSGNCSSFFRSSRSCSSPISPRPPPTPTPKGYPPLSPPRARRAPATSPSTTAGRYQNRLR